jgi:hypothetical protein
LGSVPLSPEQAAKRTNAMTMRERFMLITYFRFHAATCRQSRLGLGWLLVDMTNDGRRNHAATKKT